MFQQFTQIKSLALLPTLFVILMFFGCGTEDNIFKPETTTTSGDYGSVESNATILAAPKSQGGYYYVERVLGYRGGSLMGADIAQGTKLHLPIWALSKTTVISMEVWSDGVSRMDFHFEPHGIVFAVPVELQLPWSTLKKTSAGDLVLYYYDESLRQWVEETRAIWDEKKKKATLYIDHFSRYYYKRR